MNPLEQWAESDRERDYLAAVDEHGSIVAAAKALGLNHSTVSRGLERIKRRAALQGYAPSHDYVKVVPPGFSVRGVSTLYGEDGKPKIQWVKSEQRQDAAEEALRAFAESLTEQVHGLAPITPAPTSVMDDLLCVYPIGDPHYGLRVWREEGGGDFDLGIAERLAKGAIDRLVQSAPPAKTAVLLNLGDHFHIDNETNQTRSGHALDADGRWAKVQQIGLRAMLHAIHRLLEKHETVVFRINRGNHDSHSAYALALMVSCYFHNETRVQVDLSPAAFWYYQFGRVLIGSTHGDTVKGDKLLGVMAADRPKEWGDTTHRYWYVGHVHHQDVKEHPGGIVEYFRTLAAGDAWHRGQGYRAGRDMRLIVLHHEYGEIERHRCDVGMLEAA